MYRKRNSRQERFKKATRSINWWSEMKEEVKREVAIVHKKVGTWFLQVRW